MKKEKENKLLKSCNYGWKFFQGSIHTLGAVLGCMLSIPMMSMLGRRGAALYVMTTAYLLGYLLIGFAVNPEMIIIGQKSLVYIFRIHDIFIHYCLEIICQFWYMIDSRYIWDFYLRKTAWRGWFGFDTINNTSLPGWSMQYTKQRYTRLYTSHFCSG